jgi:26S proteasome regulatory subunit N7
LHHPPAYPSPSKMALPASGASFFPRVNFVTYPLFSLIAFCRYYLREIRGAAYTQYLESYKSVRLDQMAAALGLGVDFLDRELSEFIVSGRLHCKIDKVAGVLETNRPDARNALYQQSIRQGDLLLNRIQKLSKVAEIE